MVPGVGEVVVSIKKEEFFQAGYALRTLDSASRVNGGVLSESDLDVVTQFLKERRLIDQ